MRIIKIIRTEILSCRKNSNNKLKRKQNVAFLKPCHHKGVLSSDFSFLSGSFVCVQCYLYTYFRLHLAFDERFFFRHTMKSTLSVHGFSCQIPNTFRFTFYNLNCFLVVDDRFHPYNFFCFCCYWMGSLFSRKVTATDHKFPIYTRCKKAMINNSHVKHDTLVWKWVYEIFRIILQNRTEQAVEWLW